MKGVRPRESGCYVGAPVYDQGNRTVSEVRILHFAFCQNWFITIELVYYARLIESRYPWCSVWMSPYS